MPAGADVEAVIVGPRRPRRRRRSGLAARPRPAPRRRRPTCRGSRSPATRRARLAVVAASERALAPLVATAVAERLADRRGERRDRPTRWRCRRCSSTPSVGGVLVGAGDPPAADERRALGELAALVAAVAERRPDLDGDPGRRRWPSDLPAFGDVGERRRRGRARAGGRARRAGRPAGRAPDRAGAAAGRRAPRARRGRDGAGRGPRPARRRRRDRLRRRDPRGRPRPASAAGRRRLDLAVVPSAGARARRSRRRGRRPGRAVVDLGRRPAPPARPDARAADRAVGRCHRRRRDPADGGRPRRARPARRMRRRSGPTGRRPTSSSRPAGRGPSRPAPIVALALVDVLRRPGAGQFALDHARLLGAARVDPGPRRAPGDGRRPRRRPAGAARDGRHAGRDAHRPERRPVVVHGGDGADGST